MYIFLLEADNELSASRREVIMQREKLVNEIWFLVNPEYNENDMSIFSVILEYVLPCSKRYHTVELVKDEEGYKEYLKYVVPLDTNLSSESGDIELQLSFIFAGLDADGNSIQKVRKTKTAKLHITPIAAWSDIVPDNALGALDQRILKQDAQIKALEAYANTLGNNIVDNLKYNTDDDTLQLMSKGNGIGDKVSIKDMLDNGVPVVDFGDEGQDTPVVDDNGDIVEF